MWTNILCLLTTFYVCHGWKIQLYPSKDIVVNMGESLHIYYNITDKSSEVKPKIDINSTDDTVLNVELHELPKQSFEGNLTLHGEFLGVANIDVFLDDVLFEAIHVRVIRKPRVIDKIFTASVAILVSLIYINFGCALDIPKLIKIIRWPIGPCIGLLGQFLAMPLLSYALGLLFFPERADMRLGLLFTGVSPAGGASNVWTCVLDGNVDLSVTMTTISTFAAFGMMPLWLFTLGPHVFASAKISVPYMHVASLAGALIIPLAIGCLLKRFAPRIANPLARILKSFSAILIAFIVIFASVTNVHLFKLFTWRIAIAGLALPFFGYAFGWILARYITKRSRDDALAIAIETGVQNTGIAIFLLRFGLPQPQADLTTVVPVAVAVMTPLPLLLLWLVFRFRRNGKNKFDLDEANRAETPSFDATEGTHLQK